MLIATPEAYQLLHEGSQVLAQMEHHGLRIDVPYLEKTIAEIGIRIKELQEKLKSDPVFTDWQKKHGRKTNLGSRPQLASLLFDDMKIPYLHEFTATGRYRADEEVLKSVNLPFVHDYLRLEELKKFKSTFLEGLHEEVVDGYVHPVFNLHTVQTFRSSSNSPNFQNQPVRDEELGPLLRRCFIPRKGRVLVEVDYVGIEVKISACINKDPVLLEYINDPTKDMHRDTAAQCFLCEPEQVTKHMRYLAKNCFVFPQFYGSYHIDCARNLWNGLEGVKLATGKGMRPYLRFKGIRELGACDPKQPPKKGTYEAHIKSVQDDFWGNRFRVYAQWKKDWYAAYLRTGSFRTPTGFVIAGVYKRNEVSNYPVQGTAFHCLLWSLIEIGRKLKKKKMRTKLVGQVHDSILADVPTGEIQDYLDLTEEVMTQRLPEAWPWIITPLGIECEIGGTNWAEKKPWIHRDGTWQTKESV